MVANQNCSGLIDDADVGISSPVDYSIKCTNKPLWKVLGCSNTQNKGISFWQKNTIANISPDNAHHI